ncbi:hypothetical protein MNEG_8530 [Monoraphidium neglectum]|uniref:Methyltransferase FkbM domain-containing protein n=1 Tax=Monoraphidium neglectum TaxID=145388 RepID=A0A0D2JJD5_9CHLO|nr:hypothetical protein MNEG_8530 [Monoraphidium neglectum]KIY99432.1 hypothetical protein MNEG_8530 [Monoraphidium neglectum]|eukprot:XP_013898452.1 hypothetical protein MNEG_8530 [Monoraphidium neglectum]
MVVYASNDIVSDHIKGDTHQWESQETKEMMVALRSPVPASPRDSKHPARWVKKEAPLVVDVGANIGWFTLKAAEAGARVAAFEAMASNIQLVRTSLCANPGLMDRVALYNTGLGTQRATCSIISDVSNMGDGHTICDKDTKDVIKQWKSEFGRDYVVRGEMRVRRLDSLIEEDVQFMKIDVEGFEAEVLKGAAQLLDNHNVWFIAAACNHNKLKEAGKAEYLKFLNDQGYYISTQGFQGPFINIDDIEAGRPSSLPSHSLYCVKKLLIDAAGGPNKRRPSDVAKS